MPLGNDSSRAVPKIVHAFAYCASVGFPCRSDSYAKHTDPRQPNEYAWQEMGFGQHGSSLFEAKPNWTSADGQPQQQRALANAPA